MSAVVWIQFRLWCWCLLWCAALASPALEVPDTPTPAHEAGEPRGPVLLLRVPIRRRLPGGGDVPQEPLQFDCSPLTTPDAAAGPELTFDLYLGEEDVFFQYQQFCTLHGLCDDAGLQLAVVGCSMESLKDALDVHVPMRFEDPDHPPAALFLVNRTSTFSAALRSVCAIASAAGDVECERLSLSLLRLSWPTIERALRAAHADHFLAAARELVQDRDVVFLVDAAARGGFAAAELAEMLRAFVAFDSLRTPTLIEVSRDASLQNYSNYLGLEIVALPGTLEAIFGPPSDSGIPAELVYSSSLLVLRDEEAAFAAHRYAMRRRPPLTERLGNNKLLPLFSRHVSIDGAFDRFSVPPAVYRRLMASVGRIRFASQVRSAATTATASCQKLCLTVSVDSERAMRGWGAVSVSGLGGEGEADDEEPAAGAVMMQWRREAVARYYVQAIAAVLRKEPSISAVIVVADDPEMMAALLPFTNKTRVPLTLPSLTNGTDRAAKAAFDLLVLSSGSVLLGHREGALLEVAHWMGGLRSKVYFLPPDAPLPAPPQQQLRPQPSSVILMDVDETQSPNTTDFDDALLDALNVNVTTVDPTVLNRVDTCISHCYALLRLGRLQQGDVSQYGSCVDDCVDVERPGPSLAYRGCGESSSNATLGRRGAACSRRRRVASPYAARYSSAPSEETHFRYDRRSHGIDRLREAAVQLSCRRLWLELDNRTLAVLDAVSAPPATPPQVISEDVDESSSRKPAVKPRILCVICTVDANRALAAAAVDTWGRRCSGFVAFSDVTDPSVPAVRIPLPATEQEEEEDGYASLWFKVAAVWKYVYAHYLDEFDWFLMADDDSYIHYDNLETYLSTDDAVLAAQRGEQGVYLGRRFAVNTYVNDETHSVVSMVPNENATAIDGLVMNQGMGNATFEGLTAFNSGGAGHVLDRHALRRLATALLSESDACGSRGNNATADRTLAHCLFRQGVEAMDTRDSEGRERFHHFSPVDLAVPPDEMDWWHLHTIALYPEASCCVVLDVHKNVTYFRAKKPSGGLRSVSPQSISFHWIKTPLYMRRIHSYLTNNCSNSKNEF